jgi:hypothetical protein
MKSLDFLASTEIDATKKERKKSLDRTTVSVRGDIIVHFPILFCHTKDDDEGRPLFRARLVGGTILISTRTATPREPKEFVETSRATRVQVGVIAWK